MAKRMSHPDAKQVLLEATRVALGYVPGSRQRQIYQAMGLLESQYGSALGQMNWGAVVKYSAGQSSFVARDSKPENGHQVGYDADFRAYGSHVESAADMVKTCCNYDTDARYAKRGDVVNFAIALWTPTKGREIGYFAGLASDPPAFRPIRRAANLTRLCFGIASECKEPLLGFNVNPPELPTSRDSDRVSRLAFDLCGVLLPEDFDIAAFQRRCRIPVDGNCGPQTWGMILCTAGYFDDVKSVVREPEFEDRTPPEPLEEGGDLSVTERLEALEERVLQLEKRA